MYVPNFQDRQLMELAASTKKRQRALRVTSREVRVDRVLESVSGSRLEKLELTITPLVPSRTTLRVFVWDDRWIWVDLRRGSKRGWIFSWTHEGLLVDRKKGALQRAVEDTLAAIAEETDEVESAAKRIWTPLISTGLRLVNVAK